MRILVIAPDLGFSERGDIFPGGLESFGRSTVCALAASSNVKTLGVWSLNTKAAAKNAILDMITSYGHTGIQLDVRCFSASKVQLAAHIALANLRRAYDYVMYLLVNQAVLSLLPLHPPYAIWEIGVELFAPVSPLKLRVMKNADRLLSISKSTSDTAQQHNPGLPDATIVHLALELPFCSIESGWDVNPDEDPVIQIPYIPEDREPAVFILARIARSNLYKGHQELIMAWPYVQERVPGAELWIGGDGDGLPILKQLASQLDPSVQTYIHFLGRLNDKEVHERLSRCRIFAMPSRGEGFGLVFVEAARYGVPCIGGKLDSVKEIVLDRKTGLLVEQEPIDISRACIELLVDNELARELGESGRQRYLENFQFHHFQKRLITALNLES